MTSKTGFINIITACIAPVIIGMGAFLMTMAVTVYADETPNHALNHVPNPTEPFFVSAYTDPIEFTVIPSENVVEPIVQSLSEPIVESVAIPIFGGNINMDYPNTNEGNDLDSNHFHGFSYMDLTGLHEVNGTDIADLTDLSNLNITRIAELLGLLNDTDEDKVLQYTPQPFTPNGQASVTDQVTEYDGKEFYSFTTPVGNIFYLIIDHARANNNVYFLNAVTESDLMALAERMGVPINESAIPAPSRPPVVTDAPTEPEPSDNEKETPQKHGINNGMIIFVVIGMIAIRTAS
jgi:hypothetical protein